MLGILKCRGVAFSHLRFRILKQSAIHLDHFSGCHILVRAPAGWMPAFLVDPLQQRSGFLGPTRELKKTLARFTGSSEGHSSPRRLDTPCLKIVLTARLRLVGRYRSLYCG